MAGYRSRQLPSMKPLAEDCLALDISKWHRAGVLVPGRTFTTTWSRDEADAGSIAATITATGAILSYTLPRQDGDGREHLAYVAPIEWTACHYGGRRPWWRCPLSWAGVPCLRRARVLFLRERFFGCRPCLRLGYQSQRLPGYWRALRRALALAELVGGADPLAPLPPKPRGMHWRTYRDISAAWNTACATFVPEAERRLMRDVDRIVKGTYRQRLGR